MTGNPCRDFVQKVTNMVNSVFPLFQKIRLDKFKIRRPYTCNLFNYKSRIQNCYVCRGLKLPV